MNMQALEVESLDLEGRGVAHRDGKVVFIAGALPGERVTVETVKVKASYETARIQSIERESTLRVAPRCPHFGIGAGSCGGCSMQHLHERAQVSIKQRVLEDTLWHVGRVKPELVLRPIVGDAWGYRQRARLAVRDVAKKGGVLVGFHERASSYVADMRECHVLPPAVARLLLPLRELVGSLSIRTRLPQIEVAVGAAPRQEAEEGRPQADDASSRTAAGAHVVLVLRVLVPPTAADRDRLSAFAREHGVSLWLQDGGPDTARPLLAADANSLSLALPEFGVTIPFAPTDFTQVNHGINEMLVRRALRLLDPGAGDTVVDFFCGLGNFTLPLATRARRVIGIEGHAGLVERARAAAEANGLAARTRFARRDLFEWTRADWQQLVAEHGPISRVLVDPPREGALAIARALATTEQAPQRVVYVSCNPATLARDCAVFVHEGGWRLAGAGVVNMFPHTSHVESLAVLERPVGSPG
jgi:23S rRNA (uracil1939-C5)-methyltransferase